MSKYIKFSCINFCGNNKISQRVFELPNFSNFACIYSVYITDNKKNLNHNLQILGVQGSGERGGEE